MQNHEDFETSCEFEDWGNFADEDIMNQQSEIRVEEAQKVPFVADKVAKTYPDFFFLFSFSFFFLFASFCIL